MVCYLLQYTVYLKKYLFTCRLPAWCCWPDPCLSSDKPRNDLAYRSLCSSVAEHRSTNSEDLRLKSSWTSWLLFFHARDKKKNILLYLTTVLKIYHISFSITVVFGAYMDLILQQTSLLLFCTQD